jgi:acyl-CoA reductase-like NAD-dependent aldehyde dehydrogenase
MSARDFPLRIGGNEVTTGAWIDVHSPWSGELLARVAKAGPGEVERAIAAAAGGFEEARALPAYRRAEILRRLREELEGLRGELVATMVAEAGKPVRYVTA